MFFLPPVGDDPSLKPLKKDRLTPLPEKKLNKSLRETALKRLPQKKDSTKTSEGWSFSSLFGFRKKEEDLSSITARGREEADDLEEGEIWQDALDEEEGLSLNLHTGALKENGEVKATAIKTYQAAKQTGFKGFLLDKALQLAGNVIKTKAQDHEHSIDKAKVIKSQKQEMLNQLQDPQFIEFYDLVSSALLPVIGNKLEDLETKTDALSKTIVSQRSLVMKLVEMILARGFANLSRELKQHQSEIPHYQEQTSLANMVSFLCQKGEKAVSLERLTKLEERYSQENADLRILTSTLFPGIENQSNMEKSLHMYMQEYIQSEDEGRKEEIRLALFPDLANIQGQKAHDVQHFFDTLDKLHQKNEELHQIFGDLAEVILHSFFPNKLEDIEEISSFVSSYIPAFAKSYIPDFVGTYFEEVIFNTLRSSVSDVLQKLYEPLENNSIRNQAWNQDLTSRLGILDVKPLVEAPAAFIGAFTKNYIQSDSSAIDFTSRVLLDLVHPSPLTLVKARLNRLKSLVATHRQDKILVKILIEEINKVGLEDQDLNALEVQKQELQKLKMPKAQEMVVELTRLIDTLITTEKRVKYSGERKKNLLNEFSQKQLANWLIESTQAILNTQDPNLEGLGKFITQSLNNLTLAMMANGAKLVLSADEKIEPNEFIKILIERLTEKLNSLQRGEKIQSEFWEGLVHDLPLPEEIKEVLVSILIERGGELQKQVKQASYFQDLQNDLEEKILSYAGGKQLLNMTEKVGNRIIEEVLEQNLGLVKTLGLEDTFEELFTQYLPGIKIEDDLKNWFEANISTLQANGNNRSSQAINLLKQGLQIVLCKAMVNTIEKNFQNNSQDYAAQLLKNFQTAFSKAFVGFDDQQSKKLHAALKIQTKIEKKKDRIKEIRGQIAEKPIGLPSEQASLLENVINVNSRYIRGLNNVAKLKQKRDELLTQLNDGYDENDQILEKNFPLVNRALALRKLEASAYPSMEDYIKQLKKNIQKYERIEKSGQTFTSRQQKDLDRRQMLLTLLEMRPEELKLLSDAVTINSTLKHAKKELALLEEELNTEKAAVLQYAQGAVANPVEWKKAQDWMNMLLKSRQEISQLSWEKENLQKKLNEYLDTHLKIFQVLSEELVGILGLDGNKKLDLPPLLEKQIWPLIESAKKQQIPQLLFTEISPLLLSVSDIKKNRNRLKDLSKGNPFLGKFSQAISKEIVSRIPELVASYKPFINEALQIIGIHHPTDDDIDKMEKAFIHTLNVVGKKGVKASMLTSLVKGCVPKDREEALSQSIEKWVTKSDLEEEFTKEDALKLLKKEVKASSKKEKRTLKKQAETLVRDLNQFLCNRGKSNLQPQDVLDAYQNQVEEDEDKIAVDEMKIILEDADFQKIIQKMQAIVITPEEFAESMNDFLPGSSDLQSLIVPQLQDVIAGSDPVFQANRQIMEQCLEGTLLRLFVKIGNANQLKGQDILTVLMGKLKDLAVNAQPVQGKTKEEVAREMIDHVLMDVLNIQSSQDLDQLPLALRKLVYEKIYEQAYQQLTPLVLPIIERTELRKELKEKSGSNFLASLCTALSKDIFVLLPNGVKSYQAVSEELFVVLSDGKQPTRIQARKFAAKIAQLIKQNKVRNDLLVEAYAKATKRKLTTEDRVDLKAKLEKYKAKEEIAKILITPEKIAEQIAASIPHLDGSLQKSLAKELNRVMHERPAVYQNGTEFISSYVEGMLLRAFMRIATKNPRQKGKDTLVVVTEKLLNLASRKYRALKKGEKIEKIAQELNDAIMKDILGIDSPDAFAGLPPALKSQAYHAVKDKLGGLLLDIQKQLDNVEIEKQKVKEARQGTQKSDAVEELSSYIPILAEDIANLAVHALPHSLIQIKGEEKVGVITVSQGIEKYLEELSHGNLQVAKVLLGYTRGAQFKKMLGDRLDTLADENQLTIEREKAAQFVRDLLVDPLNRLVEKMVNFEETHQKEFNQKLIASFLHVGASHLRSLNAAKKVAQQEGRSTISHQDFIKAAGANLHPGVLTNLSYQLAITTISEKIYGRLSPIQEKTWQEQQKNVRALISKMIKDEKRKAKTFKLNDFIQGFEAIHLKVKGKPLTRAQRKALRTPDENGLTLRDLIERDVTDSNLQRRKNALAPASQVMMHLLFPNGKKRFGFNTRKSQGRGL